MEKDRADAFLEKLKTNILLRILFVVVGVAVGLFAFILPIRNDVPIARDEAEGYVGYFEKLESQKKYQSVCFRDGAKYELHPYTVPEELLKSFETMEKGTKLFLLVNPNNHYIAEIRTETEELLNFENSQQATYHYNKGYIGIGAFLCLDPIFIILLLELEKKAVKKKPPVKKRRRLRSGTGRTALIRRPCGMQTKGKKEKSY